MPGSQPSSSEPHSSHQSRLSSPCHTALGSLSAAPAGRGQQPRSVFLSLSPCQVLHIAEGPSWGLPTGDSTADPHFHRNPTSEKEQGWPQPHCKNSQGTKQDALSYLPACKGERQNKSINSHASPWGHQLLNGV